MHSRDLDAGVCRSCREPIAAVVLDLGDQPVADDLLEPDDRDRPLVELPLRLAVCTRCWLVQLARFGAPLPYVAHGHGEAFSSTAQAHLAGWAGELAENLNLGPAARVLDISSGAGYLLRGFQERGLSVLGLERDSPTAASALVPTRVAEFQLATARTLVVEDGFQADLVLVNHALAHAEDLDDLVAGLELVLAPGGAIAIEFHHVERVVHSAQFDIISHPHHSYLSLLALEPLLERHGLQLVDAACVEIYGGSMRGLVRRRAESPVVAEGVPTVRAQELEAGLDRLETYLRIGEQATSVRDNLLHFLTEASAAGQVVVGYGAPSRGTTLLNYCGIGPELLPFTVDRSPLKQGRLLPGCQIPVHAPEAVRAARPAYLLILPWALAAEISAQMAELRTWGGRFVTALPELAILD